MKGGLMLEIILVLFGGVLVLSVYDELQEITKEQLEMNRVK